MKLKHNDVLVSGIFAQLYSRLTLAACQGMYVYWNDLSPVLFGMQFDKVDDDQAEALWAILDASIKMDAKANRLPLAALFVSRKGGSRTPRDQFYVSYKHHYGKSITEQDWTEIVKQIWQSYQMRGKSLEHST